MDVRKQESPSVAVTVLQRNVVFMKRSAFRPHRTGLHKMRPIAIDDPGVCLSRGRGVQKRLNGSTSCLGQRQLGSGNNIVGRGSRYPPRRGGGGSMRTLPNCFVSSNEQHVLQHFIFSMSWVTIRH